MQIAQKNLAVNVSAAELKKNVKFLLGFCVDVGALVSIARVCEINRVRSALEKNLRFRLLLRSFCFRGTPYKSFGSINVLSDTPIGTTIIFIKANVT